MMHKKNFVTAVKVSGKILRESSDRVELPFGSEYSLLLKNLDTVRMQAKISIDGEDATGWLVLQPNSSMEVERFVKTLDRGSRFKFIERTEKIENHRGIKVDDGLIRVEFKREKVYETPKVVEHHTYHHYDYWYWPRPYVYPYNYQSGWTQWQGNVQSVNKTTFTSTSGASGSLGAIVNTSSLMRSAGPVQAQNVQCSAQNESGITVPGSISEQKFVAVSGFETEKSEVIVLHLVGRRGEAVVAQPKTVDIKAVCDTCGKKNKATSKFCSECGTSLERI